MKCECCKKEIEQTGQGLDALFRADGFKVLDMSHEDNEPHYFCSLKCIKKYVYRILQGIRIIGVKY